MTDRYLFHCGDEETCLHILGTAGAIGCQAERSSEFPFGCSVIGTRDQVMRVKEDAECNLLDLIALYVPRFICGISSYICNPLTVILKGGDIMNQELIRPVLDEDGNPYVPFDKEVQLVDGSYEIIHATGYEVCVGDPNNFVDWEYQYEDREGNRYPEDPQ